METLVNYFLYFIFYGFIGWVIEIIYNMFVLKRFVNRGFLIGPICSIYGVGFLLTVIFLGNNHNNYLEVFLKCVLVCSVLEYFTSYFMEKLFKARWWDYSRYKFNLNGRICLETMIPFGLLGCLFVCFVHPEVVRVVDGLDSQYKTIMSIILFIIYLIDNILSFNVMNKIKKQIKNSKIDNTEMIRNKVIDWINSNSRFYQRVFHAFPKFIIDPRKMSKKGKRKKEK